MTKEDWAKVEKALSGCFGYAKLMVDGHEVSFQREQAKGNWLCTVTYVDGHWKGTWISGKEQYPEQSYLRPVSKFLYSAKYREELKKMFKQFGRKKVEKIYGLALNPDEKYHYYDLSWPNVTAIPRHYQKTFTSIELIACSGV